MRGPFPVTSGEVKVPQDAFNICLQHVTVRRRIFVSAAMMVLSKTFRLADFLFVDIMRLFRLGDLPV